ncbi:MAG: sigma-70 family RNA polymerase sigma factor [Bacteroidales bacterium]|nr:sigma-70 family RNA polymerase sigma factor [Bacteroidales bacterium]
MKHLDPFDALLHRYRGLLFTLCQRYSRGGTTVEDLLQEASVALWRNHEQLTAMSWGPQQAALVWKIARNAVIDDESMSFGLNFDGTYAHFTFPTNVMAFGGNEGELAQIAGVSYEYSYNGTTHTGYLDGVADDENDDPGQLQFTYDDATDVITFVLNMFYADDNTPVTLTLNFERAE